MRTDTDEAAQALRKDVVHAMEHLSRGHAVFVTRRPQSPAEVGPDTAKAIVNLELPIKVDSQNRCLLAMPGGREEIARWVNAQPL